MKGFHQLSSTCLFVFFIEDWFSGIDCSEQPSDSALHALSTFIYSSISLFSGPHYWRSNHFSWISIVLPQTSIHSLKAHILKIICNISIKVIDHVELETIYWPCIFLCHETLFCIHTKSNFVFKNSSIWLFLYFSILLHYSVMSNHLKQRWALKITKNIFSDDNGFLFLCRNWVIHWKK